MNYRILFLIVCLSVLPVIGQAKTLLVLGDSISAAYGVPVEKGWVSLLQQRLVQNKYNYKVVNASVVGETTLGAQMRLADLLTKHKPNIVVIELGGNDGLRGISLKEIESNFIKMVSMITEVNSDALLVPMQMPPNYGMKYREGFFSIYQKVSEIMKVPVSKFIFQNIADVPGLMQADGIHPVESAHPIMLENIWPSLSKLINKDINK
ncbi:MAG: arylesterase [Proteobacteria bacterium]|nr:arylesterase [Pseudomonadota bacterium]NOG61028.1 arylesterase [Pseudomonadota bacterium]